MDLRCAVEQQCVQVLAMSQAIEDANARTVEREGVECCGDVRQSDQRRVFERERIELWKVVEPVEVWTFEHGRANRMSPSGALEGGGVAPAAGQGAIS